MPDEILPQDLHSKLLLLLLLALSRHGGEVLGRSADAGQHWRRVNHVNFAGKVPVAKYQSR